MKLSETLDKYQKHWEKRSITNHTLQNPNKILYCQRRSWDNLRETHEFQEHLRKSGFRHGFHYIFVYWNSHVRSLIFFDVQRIFLRLSREFLGVNRFPGYPIGRLLVVFLLPSLGSSRGDAFEAFRHDFHFNFIFFYAVMTGLAHYLCPG